MERGGGSSNYAPSAISQTPWARRPSLLMLARMTRTTESTSGAWLQHVGWSPLWRLAAARSAGSPPMAVRRNTLLRDGRLVRNREKQVSGMSV